MIEAAILDQIAQLRRELEMEVDCFGKKGVQVSGTLFGCLFLFVWLRWMDHLVRFCICLFKLVLNSVCLCSHQIELIFE